MWWESYRLTLTTEHINDEHDLWFPLHDAQFDSFSLQPPPKPAVPHKRPPIPPKPSYIARPESLEDLGPTPKPPLPSKPELVSPLSPVDPIKQARMPSGGRAGDSPKHSKIPVAKPAVPPKVTIARCRRHVRLLSRCWLAVSWCRPVQAVTMESQSNYVYFFVLGVKTSVCNDI